MDTQISPQAREKCGALVAALRELASEENRAGMRRYGINVATAFGVSVYDVRRLSKGLRDHGLAACLWETGLHEARVMAALVDEPTMVTPEQMEAWAAEFDSWDLTDQVTTSLFDLSPYGWDKAHEWARRDEEYVKRGAFALMAGLAVHDKTSSDERFERELLPLIESEAGDPRNFVKKAVNWALRNIGKRSPQLHSAAIASAERILEGRGGAGSRGGTVEDRAARWVANDALRELRGDKVRSRLGLLDEAAQT